MGAIVSVTSDSSSSESESEESGSLSVSSEASDDSDSSDSDGLENWMILGRENQDGDQSISLNLEGVCAGGSGGTRLCFRLFVSRKTGDLSFVPFSRGPVLIYLQHIDKEPA